MEPELLAWAAYLLVSALLAWLVRRMVLSGVWLTISKSCGHCGKRVSLLASVGDRCPHCGVIWSAESAHRRTSPIRKALAALLPMLLLGLAVWAIAPQALMYFSPQDRPEWERPSWHLFLAHEIVGPDGGAMVWVRGGTLEMGSSHQEVQWASTEFKCEQDPWLEYELFRPDVQVGSYWLAKHEVTNRQYRLFCEETDRLFPAGSDQGPDHPVVCVTWDDAMAYAKHHGLALPSESEWEYAARGRAGRRFPWGHDWEAGRLCWGARRGPGGQTFPVGCFPTGKSWRGALDLAGNAWEWCADWQPEYKLSGVPCAPEPGTEQCRAVRGGSWCCGQPLQLRGAYRRCCKRETTDISVGFRCISRVQAVD